MTIANNHHLKTITLLVATTLPFFGALGYFVLLPNSPSTSALYSLVKLAMIVVGLFSWWILKIKPPQPFKFKASYIILGLATGIVISTLISIVFLLLQDQILPFVPAISDRVTSLIPLSLFFPIAVTFSLVHSLLEEIYWRGVVQIGTGSVAIAAIAFSAHHFIVLNSALPLGLSLVGTIAIAGGGYLWGLLTQKTGGLVANWISHALVDLTIFAIIYNLIS